MIHRRFESYLIHQIKPSNQLTEGNSLLSAVEIGHPVSVEDLTECKQPGVMTHQLSIEAWQIFDAMLGGPQGCVALIGESRCSVAGVGYVITGLM